VPVIEFTLKTAGFLAWKCEFCSPKKLDFRLTMMNSDEIRGFGIGDEFHATLKMVESVLSVYRNCPVLVFDMIVFICFPSFREDDIYVMP